eukprot:CAMPEP_0177650898 /NCGR_PEP_ID=MMETSP0447-20121125/12219_1 /TAXON_ID=0 /ORGANISM="Stygamoeba regulata, Strain BSH-02190019" /LENGTH=293 /DNA_ID=CAMNT_0019153861 /DNA_START=31 /DNA_END=912 /DNA_ORIENTATION=+
MKLLSCLLVLLYALCWCCTAANARVASSTECNHISGHGFVLFSDLECTTHWIHHLPEFQCPHMYDVKAQVQFVNATQERIYCQDRARGEEFTYTVVPEFVLPRFIAGEISSFSSPLTRGFFNSTLVDDVAMTVQQDGVIFARQFDMLTAQTLTYYLWPASANPFATSSSSASSSYFYMSHYVTTPPNFDQLMMARVYSTDGSWEFPADRRSPLAVYFPGVSDVYASRLRENLTYKAVIQGALNGQQHPVTIETVQNYYPGPAGYNGDGTTDYREYCVDKEKPHWVECVGLMVQ